MKIEIRDSFLKDIKKLSKETKQKIEIIFGEMENAHFLHRKEIYRFFP